jgi:hypothetical protein
MVVAKWSGHQGHLDTVPFCTHSLAPRTPGRGEKQHIAASLCSGQPHGGGCGLEVGVGNSRVGEEGNGRMYQQTISPTSIK